MSSKKSLPTIPPRPKAFLIGVDVKSEPSLLPIEDSLEELALLAETAGLDVVGELFQRLNSPNPVTYIGTGKVDEVKIMLEDTESQVVVFDNELSPRHLRELEERFGENIHVIDRTALILDIFALHARTKEGKLQVELAQYQYRLPRLTRAWTHLARQAGGGGGRTGSAGGVGLRGPGETQLELDRRDIEHRISLLKKELDKVRAHRARYRKTRKQNNIPVISLVGYTNAGKSTLLNYLTDADIYIADQLFATLDPTTRRFKLPSGSEVLFTDTVGFIQKLPTDLVAAFRATLEEITESDMLLHVIDASHPNALAQYQSVLETLKEIGADIIPTLTVMNKIDKLPRPLDEMHFSPEFVDPIFISALTGKNMDQVFEQIEDSLFEEYTFVTVQLPFEEGQLASQFHQYGKVEEISHSEDGITISGYLPHHLIGQYQSYIELIRRKPN